jgi:hypothetical protein
VSQANGSFSLVLPLPSRTPGTISLSDHLFLQVVSIDLVLFRNQLCHLYKSQKMQKSNIEIPALPLPPAFFFLFSVVFNDAGLDHEDDVLGNVRRMVRDPFQAAAHDHQVDTPRDRLGIRNHIRQEFSKDLIV